MEESGDSPDSSDRMRTGDETINDERLQSLAIALLDKWNQLKVSIVSGSKRDIDYFVYLG
jgi:hypothetical protein